MNKKILTTIIIIVIVLALGLISYNHYTSRQNRNNAPIQKVVLGAEASLLPAAVWVAEAKNYFVDEGLDVTIKEFDSGKLSFFDMLDGGVDISTVAPTPIMFKSFERQDFSIFATFTYSYNDIKVIARQDKGITKAADLVGKKIGITSGTTGQFYLGVFLTINGLSPSDVEEVGISPSELPSALENGDVDAIIIWEPHAHNARKLLGDKSIRIPSSDVYKTTFNFVTRNDFANMHPDSLTKFLRAINRATSFMHDNEQDAQNIVIARLELDKEIMSTFWKDFVFEISLSQALLTTLEDEARWAINTGLTDATEIPNYLKYIYYQALDEVDSGAITVIR